MNKTDSMVVKGISIYLKISLAVIVASVALGLLVSLVEMTNGGAILGLPLLYVAYRLGKRSK
jgi:hypothetical protein